MMILQRVSANFWNHPVDRRYGRLIPYSVPFKKPDKTFWQGFGVDNLQRMRKFYLEYKPETIYATLSRISVGQHKGNIRDVLNLSTYCSFTPRKFNSLMDLYTLQWGTLRAGSVSRLD